MTSGETPIDGDELTRGRARTVVVSARVGWCLAGGWALGTAACTLARPGELLELALIGVAGLLAWPLVRGVQVTATTAVLFVTCFSAPLLNTWPVRVYDSARAGLSPGVWGLTGVASLLVLAAMLLHTGWRRRVPSLFLTVIALFVLAAVASSLASAHPGAAAANAWVSLVAPALFGLLIAQSAVGRGTLGRLLGVTILAAGVPVSVGLAAYILEFGFPTSGAALAVAKADLYRPHLFQDVTFGNVDHLSAFALVLLPVAATLALSRLPRVPRVGAAVVTVELAGTLLLVLSRSALAVAVVALVALAAALALALRRTDALLPAALALVLVAVSLAPGVRHSFSQLASAPGASTASTSTPASTSTSASTQSSTPASSNEGSLQMRLSAMRTGLRIFTQHAPWGVGSGEYATYDPVHTAPHSLPVQILSENGALGLAALVGLAAFILVASTRSLLRLRRRFVGSALRLGCGIGALALLGEGTIAGVALNVGPVTTWAMLLWLLTGLLATPEESGLAGA